jgi:hypothetical protein
MPANDPIGHKLALDTQLVDVYLTGLQSEIEAKLRRVAKFREEMRKMDAAGSKTDRLARRRAARALIRQAQTMLETNLVVRGMLEDLLQAAEAVLRDVESRVRCAACDMRIKSRRRTAETRDRFPRRAFGPRRCSGP